MQNILYFDVCSIPIFLVIFITVFVRRMTKGNTNRLFIALIILSAVCAFSDVILEYCCRSLPISDVRLITADIFTHIYFLTRTATIVVYFFFIFSVTGTWYRVRSAEMKVVLLIPMAVMYLMIFTNMFTGAVFTITPEEGYRRGYAIYVLYAICVLYAFIGTIYLLVSCRRFLPVGKLVALLAMYVLSMIAVVVQYFMPFLMIEMIVTAFSLILVVLFLLRPEEISDASVGSLSFGAYRSDIRKVLMTKQKVQIAVISFINARELQSYFGEERYLFYVSHVIKQLNMMFHREHIFFDIYFEQPGTVYIMVDDPNYDIEDAYKRLAEELRRSSDIAASAGERIIPRACNIVIPDDLSDIDEIIKFGREFHTQMPQGRIFAKAAEIISSRDYKVMSNIDTILSRAITQNKFRMYYQPIYSVEQKKFVSAEALIRLNDEEYGFVSPGIFIPAAEKRGIIIPIGDFVLEDVHRFISDIDFEKLGLEYIEINLSVAQCMQEELPGKLAVLSEKYGVSPDKINLEITETTYENTGNIMEFNLEALSGMGYTFSLDDYGTGYSNMHRVSKLPLKIIKLDKTLVDGMASEEGRSIVRNTVKMMRDIDKELVAEGVETQTELHSLEDMGCHFIQGYCFSKPLPADEFVKFVREHNRVNA
ncbi:MAG: EAL domain-containing protein [Ruminiclostridium sp.]|nr:EAL domain-containing protein [Ruminiclostridium sp.]